MIKVTVNGKLGETSSVIPHSTGKYPVWFGENKIPEFVEAKDVVFI